MAFEINLDNPLIELKVITSDKSSKSFLTTEQKITITFYL